MKPDPQNENSADPSIARVDDSQQRIYNISQTGSIIGSIVNTELTNRNSIMLDGEAANLLDWLASQQSISREIALKKALATASYIYDLTNQGGKLLVRRRDNSVGEIVLR